MTTQKKGTNQESIRSYLSTRSRSKQALEEKDLEHTPDLVQNDKMATDEVTNAELRQLILGLDTKMSSSLKDIDVKLDTLANKIEGLDHDVEIVKTAQKEDRREILDLRQEVEELRRSLLHTQVYSRKYHLLIYGVDGYETSPTDTIQKVRTFAKENLKLGESEVKQMSIRNAHRLQKRDDNTTPIIVVFLYWAERDAFFRAGKNLKGTKMSVRTDLPPELKRKRGALAHQAFEIRRDEKIHARVAERGADIYIETRNDSSDRWARRNTTL
jgi:hypothetical protein